MSNRCPGGVPTHKLASIANPKHMCALCLQQTNPSSTRVSQPEGPVYIVKSRDGSELKVSLADNAGVTAVVKASLSDIKKGAFVGVASMPQADGGQRALECSSSRKQCAASEKATIHGTFAHRA